MSNASRRELLIAAAATGGLAAANQVGAAQGQQADELPTFRYAIENQKGRVTEGGSAKEATVKQLPVSTGIAGVSMRLKPGGLRELHWHANAAEWAFVVEGRVRTTVIAPDGTSETNDFEPGDVWYFPRGHGHALQGLGPKECHFVLVFDNGAFSEHGTFSLTDWLALTPPTVLAKTLGLPATTFSTIPKEELYIVQGRVPPQRSRPPLQGALRDSALTHRFPLMAQREDRFAGGAERRVSVKEFPISTTIAGAIMDLEPGAVREPHWHPHANEWQYYISGTARMTVFGSGGLARTENLSPGDVAYVQQGYGHYIENTGGRPCRILIAFDKGEYQEISLSTWLASNPADILADNLKVAEATVESFPKRRVFIAPRT
jgi:oxalate decarboxylase